MGQWPDTCCLFLKNHVSKTQSSFPKMQSTEHAGIYLGPYCIAPLRMGGRGKGIDTYTDAQAASCGISHKILCIWPRSLISTATWNCGRLSYQLAMFKHFTIFIVWEIPFSKNLVMNLHLYSKVISIYNFSHAIFIGLLWLHYLWKEFKSFPLFFCAEVVYMKCMLRRANKCFIKKVLI